MIAVDTNLLVYAHRAATPEHKAAQHALAHAAADPGGWGFSIGNVLEFWSVVTHPAAAGRPSTPTEAARFLRNLVDSGGAAIWLPVPGFEVRLLERAGQLNLAGSRVFDLQVAMIALDHGAREIWTHDRGFVVLPGLSVRDPIED